MFYTLFPCLIYDTQLNFKKNNVLAKIMKDIQKNNLDKDDKKSYTLDGFDWKSDKAIFDLDVEDGLSKKEADVVLEFKKELISALDVYKNEFTRIHGKPRASLAYKSWFVIYKSKSQQELHTHGDSMFTSVYFVKSPKLNNDNEGKLVIYNRVSEYDGIRRYMIKPKPGRLVIFPSSYPHNVFPHYSKDDRMTIITDVKERKADIK